MVKKNNNPFISFLRHSPYRKEHLLSLFTRLAYDPRFTIFVNELSFSPLLGKGYKGGNKDRNPLLKNNSKLNGIYLNEGPNHFVMHPMSSFDSAQLYLFIIEYQSLINENKLDNIILDNNDNKQTLEALFGAIFKDLLELETTSHVDKSFIKLVAKLTTMQTSSIVEFSYYMSQAFTAMFLRVYHQSQMMPRMQRTNLAIELTLSIIHYMISKLNNPKLNTLIRYLEAGKIQFMKKEQVETLMALVSAMVNQTALGPLFKEYFSYKKDKQIVHIDSAYHELLAYFILDKFYLLYDNFSSIKLKFNSVNWKGNQLLELSKTYKLRLVRYGNLIVNLGIIHNLCYPKMEYKFNVTTSFIYLVNTDFIKGLKDTFIYKKPRLMDKMFSPKAFENVASRKGMDANSYRKSLALYSIQYDHMRQSVHANMNTHLKFNKADYNYTPSTKYTIDHEMLKMFMLMIEHCELPEFKRTVSSFDRLQILMAYVKYEPLQHILCIYDITFASIQVLLEKYPNIKANFAFHKALYKLIIYLVDFTRLGYDDIRDEILGYKSFNGHIVIKELLDKVLQYKFNLIGTVKDAIIYSHFKYFVGDSFLDTRGRLYNQETFLNIQNNPICKMFVKPYADEAQKVTPRVLNTIRYNLPIGTLSSYKTLKFEFNSNTRVKDLVESNALYVLDYIYDFFDPQRLSKHTFHIFLVQCGYHNKSRFLITTKEFKSIKYFNHIEQLSFIRCYLKKPKKLWIVLQKIRSFIATESNQYIDVDVNQSGSQMISNLTFGVPLAIECNLMGTGSFDSYTKILQGYNRILVQMEDLIVDFSQTHKLNALLESNTCKENILLASTLKEEATTQNKELIYTQLLNANIHKSPAIKPYLVLAFTLFKETVPSIAPNVDYLIPKTELDLIHELFIGEHYSQAFREFCNYILLLRVAFRLGMYMNKYKWLQPTSPVWKDRELFKKPLMTLYYNATRYTRMEHFTQFFLDQGNSQQDIVKESTFTYLANNLELYFINYSRTSLQGISAMLNLTKILTSKNQPITISNQYFDICLNPTVHKSVQVETRTLQNVKQQLSILVPTPALNMTKMSQSLSPNIIHSMDSWVMHRFCEIIQHINKELMKKKQGFQITYYTNHDTFGCNVPVILPLLLKSCYYDLIQENYLSCITNLTPQEIKELQENTQAYFALMFIRHFNYLFIK